MLSPMKTGDGHDSPDFGWFMREPNGEKVLTHSGFRQSTSTYLSMAPGKGFALALMANMEDVNQGELASQIAAILVP